MTSTEAHGHAAHERLSWCHHRFSSVLSDADTVTVKTHGHTGIDIAGMDIIPRQVKVPGDDGCKGIIGSLVKETASPGGEVPVLLPGKVIGQHRGIVPLYNESRLSCCISGKGGLHSIPVKDVGQFTRQAIARRHCRSS